MPAIPLLYQFLVSRLRRALAAACWKGVAVAVRYVQPDTKSGCVVTGEIGADVKGHRLMVCEPLATTPGTVPQRPFDGPYDRRGLLNREETIPEQSTREHRICVDHTVWVAVPVSGDGGAAFGGAVALQRANSFGYRISSSTSRHAAATLRIHP